MNCIRTASTGLPGWRRFIHGLPQDNCHVLAKNEVKYPEIKRFRNRDEEEEAKLKDKVKGFRTVEEKLYYMNMPKYYGWPCHVIHAAQIQPTSLDLVRYLTNTAVVSVDQGPYSLPNSRLADRGLVKELAAQVRPHVIEVLVSHQRGQSARMSSERVAMHETGGQSDLEEVRSKSDEPAASLLAGINRVLMAHASGVRPHLSPAESVVDVRPRVEAFWFRGPIDADARMIRKRRGTRRTKVKLFGQEATDETYPEDKVREPYDRPIQFVGNTLLQVRCRKALSGFPAAPEDPAALEEDGSRSPEEEPVDLVPSGANTDPVMHGYGRKLRHGTNLPGFWPGSRTPFVHLSLISNLQVNSNLTNSTSWQEGSEFNERADMLLAKLVASSFGTCLAQACFRGYSPVNDPPLGSHPIVHQTAVTDGRLWKFGAYQLNKTSLQGLSDPEECSARPNLCWHSPERSLFTAVDAASGQVEGFDDSVLEDLVGMYLAEPTLTEEEIENSMSADTNGGYLAKGDKKYAFNVEDDYVRHTFYASFRHVYSNRPRAIPRPEILAYEKLFMIDHPAMWHQLGLREQPWFIMKNLDFKGREHWDPEYRWLDYTNGPYVPKKFRSEGTLLTSSGVKRVSKYDRGVPMSPPLPRNDL